MFFLIKILYFAVKYSKKQQIIVPGLSKPNSFNLVYFTNRKIKINPDIKIKKLFLGFFKASLFSVNKYAIIKNKTSPFKIWIS